MEDGAGRTVAEMNSSPEPGATRVTARHDAAPARIA